MIESDKKLISNYESAKPYDPADEFSNIDQSILEGAILKGFMAKYDDDYLYFLKEGGRIIGIGRNKKTPEGV